MKTPTYKSGLERKFSQQFGLPYETARLAYVQTHHYAPDWQLAPDHYLETKGRWVSSDRAKLKRVLEHHPHVKVVMVFQNPDTPLNKGSKTTYGQYCDKHGILWFRFGDSRLHDYIKEHTKP